MKASALLSNVLIIILGLCFVIQSCVTSTEESTETVVTITEQIVEAEVKAEEGMEKSYQALVVPIIKAIKTGDKAALAEYISFPLDRVYPIPSIKDEAEFLERYNEVFDAVLIQEIINSDPATDWSDVGWRGIMFSHGSVWIDYDGNIIAVNHQSEVEKSMKERLIKAERNALHKSIQNYIRPVMIMETDKFRIRIDELEDTYRYASWSLPQTMGEKPDLIINNGKFIGDGSGGNHHYEFENNGYLYNCSVIVMGEGDHAPAYLKIFKEAEEILYQPAKIIMK